MPITDVDLVHPQQQVLATTPSDHLFDNYQRSVWESGAMMVCQLLGLRVAKQVLDSRVYPCLILILIRIVVLRLGIMGYHLWVLRQVMLLPLLYVSHHIVSSQG